MTDTSIFCGANGYGGPCTGLIGHRGYHTGTRGEFSYVQDSCGAPQPGSAILDCDRPAGHNGDHASCGSRWPRPKGGQLAPEVRDLLDEALENDPNAWEQARFPVAVTTTQRHIVWVEADSADEALATLQDDSEWYEHIGSGTEVDGGYDYAIERPADSDWDHIYHGQKHGPAQHCDDCDATGYPDWPDHIPHGQDCPQNIRNQAVKAGDR